MGAGLAVVAAFARGAGARWGAGARLGAADFFLTRFAAGLRAGAARLTDFRRAVLAFAALFFGLAAFLAAFAFFAARAGVARLAVARFAFAARARFGVLDFALAISDSLVPTP